MLEPARLVTAEIAAELERSVIEELDYRREARMAAALAHQPQGAWSTEYPGYYGSVRGPKPVLWVNCIGHREATRFSAAPSKGTR